MSSSSSAFLFLFSLFLTLVISYGSNMIVLLSVFGDIVAPLARLVGKFAIPK